MSVGDAFGELFFAPEPQRSAYLIEGQLPEGPWPFTDDTNMTLSVVDALRRYGRIDADALAASFAAHYDRSRGYGPSVHRVLRDIGADVPWPDAAASQFGGQGSFGNGAAMRAGPIGAYFAGDMDAVVTQTVLASRITHTHSEGIAGAIGVAVAAALATRTNLLASDFLDAVSHHVPESEVAGKIRRARDLGEDATHDFAVSVLGNGSRLSAQDTVPYCLWCVAHAMSTYETALWRTVQGLGDRDTTCATVGSIVVLRTGIGDIPLTWRNAREPLPSWYLASAGD